MYCSSQQMKDTKYYLARLKYYKEVVGVLAAKSLKVRYKNSILGFLWALMSPLFMLLVFTFVFRRIAGMGIPNYTLYVCSGLLFWNLFISSTAQTISSIWGSGGILKSVNLPPSVFPLSMLVANFVNFIFMFVIFFVFMFFVGLVPSFKLFLIIPFCLIFLVFIYGFCLTLASFNVFFRDVEMFWVSVSPILFYLTPVVYNEPSIMKYLRFNPITHYLVLARDILHLNQLSVIDIPVSHYLIPIALSIIMMAIGQYTYNSLRRGFISNF
jgi:lipopolysaccharide transport system permease protein